MCNPNEPQMCWGSWDRRRFWDLRAIFQQELIPVNQEVLLFQRLGAPTGKRLSNLQVIQDQYYISTWNHGMFCWKHCRGVCFELYSFPSPCCWPVYNNKTRKRSRMDDTGARDQNLVCVSKGSFHAWKPGSCIHQIQRTLFFHFLSQETSKREMSKPSIMLLAFFLRFTICFFKLQGFR